MEGRDGEEEARRVRVDCLRGRYGVHQFGGGNSKCEVLALNGDAGQNPVPFFIGLMQRLYSCKVSPETCLRKEAVIRQLGSSYLVAKQAKRPTRKREVDVISMP